MLTIRPWRVIGFVLLPTALAGVIAIIIGLGAPWTRALCVAGGLAIIPLVLAPRIRLQVGPAGISAVNLIRRRDWEWGDVAHVGVRPTTLFGTRGIQFAQLVIEDGTRRFPVLASTWIRRQTCDALLDALRQAQERHAFTMEIDPEWFPVLPSAYFQSAQRRGHDS